MIYYVVHSGSSAWKKASLDIIEMVLHDGKDTSALAIVSQSVACDDMGIPPHTAGGASALPELLTKTVG